MAILLCFRHNLSKQMTDVRIQKTDDGKQKTDTGQQKSVVSVVIKEKKEYVRRKSFNFRYDLARR